MRRFLLVPVSVCGTGRNTLASLQRTYLEGKPRSALQGHGPRSSDGLTFKKGNATHLLLFLPYETDL